MSNHDALPPEWRAISRQVKGTIVANKYKQGWAIQDVLTLIHRQCYHEIDPGTPK